MKNNILERLTLSPLRKKIFLKKAKLPELYDAQTSIDNSYDNLSDFPRNIMNGVTNAAYGNRFAIIPFEYFTAIFCNKNPSELNDNKKEMIELSNKNNLVNRIGNVSEYIAEFQSLRDDFINSFESQGSVNNEALSVLREEIFHNKHLSNTTVWTFSQVLTISYRLATTYLVYYRNKLNSKISNKQNHLKITQFLLNIYFIRQSIAKFTTPIVESYYHYKDKNLSEVEKVYGSVTKKMCDCYLEIDDCLEKSFTEEKHLIIEHISKVVLDYPFAYQTVNYTGADYTKFHNYFKMIPANRFIALSKYIIENKFESTTEIIDKVTNYFNETSIFEKEFGLSFLFYMRKVNIPKRLIYLMLKQSIVTKYRKVFFHYAKEFFTGAKKMNNSYRNMPAIKSFGLGDQMFNIDPAMSLFSSEAFIIANNSFEPTLAGDNGYTDIAHSSRCISLLVQTILLKAIYFVCETQSKKADFIEDYNLTFRARPFLEMHKHQIKSDFLPIFYEKAEQFKMYYKSNYQVRNPFDMHFAMKFEEVINDLVIFVKKQDEPIKSSYLLFCELNYTHGF